MGLPTIQNINKSEIILKAENLSKIFISGDIKVQAVQGINLAIHRGELISLMGASGSGKSSLLNLLGGLDSPSEGHVYLEDVDLGTMTDKQLTQLRRHKIGFIFQSYNLLSVLNAFENVELPMIIAGISSKIRKKRAKDLLESVGLTDRINHKPDELSGGQKQRVAIARALANRPSILLCDEPTGDLDTDTGNQIIELLLKLNKDDKQTIVIVTHDIAVASRTQKTYYIKDGQIINIKYHK